MLVFCKTVFNCYVASVDTAGFTQATAERCRKVGSVILPQGVQEPDRGRDVLLRACRERPRRRRATEQRDEFAASHSITSSAIASTPGGIVRSSDLATLRLIISSNLLDCTTGSSAGREPLKILPL